MDKQIKRNYEQGSPDEVMARFDREELWSRINEELPARPAKKYYLGWITHAAAAVAGILLVLLFYPKAGKEQLLTATRTLPPVSLPEKEAVARPAAPVATVISKQATITQPGLRKIQHQPVLPPSPEELPVAQNKVPEPVIVKEQEPVLPQTQTVALQVKHLLDIGNEDRKLMDDGTFPAAKSPLIRLNRPGGTIEEQSPVALRRFFNISE